jgi:hypothetical protein
MRNQVENSISNTNSNTNLITNSNDVVVAATANASYGFSIQSIRNAASN